MITKKHVRYFLLNQHVPIFWYESMLTNKFCKTGECERTLLRGLFLKA